MRINAEAVGADRLATKLRDVAKRATRQAITELAYEGRNLILLNLQGRVLRVRSGALLRTWSRPPQIKDDGRGGVYAVLSSNLAYAAIHEFGGTIRPKNARSLAIPVGRMLRASGTQKGYSAREFIADPGILGFVSSFFLKSKRIIMGVTSSGEAEPVFMLRASVTIPARGYLSKAMTALRARMPQIVSRAVLAAGRAAGLVQ